MAESTDIRHIPIAQMARREPPAALAGIVSRIVGYRETGRGHFRQVETASLDIPLVISFGEPFAIGLGRTPDHNDRHGSFTAGLFAGPVTIDSFGAAHCLQVNFTPLGARRFFGMPMAELTNTMVTLDDMLGTEGMLLGERLAESAGWEKRFDIAMDFVLERISGAASPIPEIAWAMDTIMQGGGKVRVSSIARQVGWSRKHLAGRFRDEVGLGPKSVSRIVRINTAIAAARSGDAWASIAADCGYADQAHMVREFRELAGRAPVAWAAQG